MLVSLEQLRVPMPVTLLVSIQACFAAAAALGEQRLSAANLNVGQQRRRRGGDTAAQGKDRETLP
jgi:hypothetical protein